MKDRDSLSWKSFSGSFLHGLFQHTMKTIKLILDYTKAKQKCQIFVNKKCLFKFSKACDFFFVSIYAHHHLEQEAVKTQKAFFGELNSLRRFVVSSM